MRRITVTQSDRAGWVDLEFEYDVEIIAIVRALRTRRWNPNLKHWQVPVALMDELATALKPAGVTIQTAPSPKRPATPTTEFLMERAEQEMRLCGYSDRTRHVYLKLIQRFLNDTGTANASVESARTFLLDRLSGGISVGYHGQLAAALRFFCTRVLGEPLVTGALPSPRRGRQLPNVLSVQDIGRLIASPRNPAHRLMLLLLYSAGLRVGELVRLRVCDVDRDRRLIAVRRGKGQKDRVTLYSERVAQAMDAYALSTGSVLREHDAWIFPGARGGARGDRPITSRTVQHVVKSAAKRAGILRPVSPHTLRHSFATHLLEQGVSLRHIQELLGHASSRTTDIYTHVTARDLIRIRSPVDLLNYLD